MLIAKAPRDVTDTVSGIITLLNWTMAPDGRRYLFFWSKRWQIVTDAEMPVSNFRSSERWQMVALAKNGEVLAVFPGCQVKAWLRRDQSPGSSVECYPFPDEYSE